MNDSNVLDWIENHVATIFSGYDSFGDSVVTITWYSAEGSTLVTSGKSLRDVVILAAEKQREVSKEVYFDARS